MDSSRQSAKNILAREESIFLVAPKMYFVQFIVGVYQIQFMKTLAQTVIWRTGRNMRQSIELIDRRTHVRVCAK